MLKRFGYSVSNFRIKKLSLSITRWVSVSLDLEVFINLLSAKLTKWPNALKQFVGNLTTNCLSVFGHFMGLALKGLTDR